MSLSDILRHRLHNQHLTRAKYTDPAEMVAWLGAVQAQDYPAAKWALGQRLRGANEAALDQAFNEGAILRTHVMRPTWHFVAPADIRWLLALTGPRVRALLGYYSRQLQIDAGVLKRGHAAFTKALQGGKPLTRAELAAALQAAGIHQSGQGMGHILMHAELQALICSGPRRGKQFTYMLLEERVPPARALDQDEALAELTRRYFTSHGPALVPDFVWWSGLTATQVKRGLEMVKGELAHETVFGKEYWSSPNARPLPIPESTYLLPNYDEYTIAYKYRDDFYPAAAFKTPVTRDNAPFAHMIVSHGRIVGIWRRTLAREAALLETRFLHPPNPAKQRALAAAVKRYGEFLGLPIDWPIEGGR